MNQLHAGIGSRRRWPPPRAGRVGRTAHPAGGAADAVFVMDYGMDLDAATPPAPHPMRAKRLVIGDVRLPTRVQETLRARLDYEEARVQEQPRSLPAKRGPARGHDQ